jgi:copper chaperone CopZ
MSLRSNVGRALPENQTLESVDILDQRQYLVHWIFLQLFTTADSAGFLVGGFKMKRWLTLTLLATLAMMAQTVFAKTLEVEVHGMTCAFCVDSLERKLTAMPSVAKVQVSLKANKVRLETDGNTPSIETIKQAILDAGFTPVKVTVISDEKNKE